MPTQAIAGKGTQLQRETTPAVFVTITEVRSITGPSATREEIDVTNLDSVGGYREYIPGFRDAGEITATINWTPTGYANLKDDFEDDGTINYKIVMPDAGAMTLAFAAFCTAIPLNIVPDDAITFDITLRLTGTITVTS